MTDDFLQSTTWGVKRVVIGITDPTANSLANFDILKHCFEVLVASLLNVEALDLRSRVDQVR